MKTLNLVQDNGTVRKYQLEDGRCITIDVSDDSRIKITDKQNTEIGAIELSYVDYELPGTSSSYKITWMYLDLKDNSYTKKGIGRQALIFFQEIYGMPITASENDGLKKDDGSHLTQNAPYFVEKMRDEGTIE